MSRSIMALIVFSGIVSVPASAHGQVTLTSSGSYFQNFDTLGSGGLPLGWSVQINATSASLGLDASSAFTRTATNWRSNISQFANFASALNTNVTGSETSSFQSSLTNRALGVRQTSGTSGFGDPGAGITLHLTNTTGYQNFNLSFSAQLLDNETRNATFTVRYATGASPSSFTSLGTFDTNSLGNGTFGATPFSASLSGIDNSADPVWIQITELNPSSGSDSLLDTFAIDDVQLTYTPVPEPTTTGLIAVVGLSTAGLVRRIRRTRMTP